MIERRDNGDLILHRDNGDPVIKLQHDGFLSWLPPQAWERAHPLDVEAMRFDPEDLIKIEAWARGARGA